MSTISVKNLTKTFKNFTAVDDLSFEVPKNHIVGFLGPNGAGKTTTLRMLVGLSNPTSGKINIAGSAVVFGKNSGSNLKIGYLPELPSMYGWMSGREYLKFIADTFQITDKKQQTKIAELVKLVDLEQSIDKKIATYSGGMKQRLGIAQALINNPEVIILDEPVSALDPMGRKEVLEIIQKLRKTRTILFSTHILSDVDRICDDVVIINHGKLVVSSPLAELKAKYAQPIIEVIFDSNPGKIISNLNKQPWVMSISQEGNTLRIRISDEKIIDDNTPLKFLISFGIGINKYGLVIPETEELFIRLLEAKS